MPPGAVRSSPRFSPRPAARPACLPRIPLRPSSAHPFPTGLAACLIGSSVRPLPRIAPLPAWTTSRSGAGRKCDPHRREVIGGGWRTAGGVVVACLSWDGVGRRAMSSEANSGRRAVVVASPSGRAWVGRVLLACLGAAMWAGRFCRFFSFHRLIQSATVPGSSNHPIDGEGLSFPFRPTPSRLLFSACLPGACSPVPGRGMCGLRYGLRWRACVRAACLRSSSPVSLSRSRSFACCYMSSGRRFALFSIRGVVWRFTGYSCRYPVGVGVFQYMPLNGILWLLTGIFGDVVRCSFSSLPVASSSPLCLLRCPRCHLPRAPCVSLSPISAPCASFSSSLPFLCLFPPRVLVWFLIASLPVPSTSRAGRSCLLASFVAALVPSSRVPHLVFPVLACPTADRSRPPPSRAVVALAIALASSPLLVSHRFRVFSPRSSTSGGGRGGCRLVICLLASFVLGCGPPVVRCVRAVIVGEWRRAAGCCLLALGWRLAVWCRRRVVFGLWCRCLYI